MHSHTTHQYPVEPPATRCGDGARSINSYHSERACPSGGAQRATAVAMRGSGPWTALRQQEVCSKQRPICSSPAHSLEAFLPGGCFSQISPWATANLKGGMFLVLSLLWLLPLVPTNLARGNWKPHLMGIMQASWLRGLYFGEWWRWASWRLASRASLSGSSAAWMYTVTQSCLVSTYLRLQSEIGSDTL